MRKFIVCLICFFGIFSAQNSYAQSLFKTDSFFAGGGFSFLKGRGSESFGGGGLDLSLGHQYVGTPLIVGCETMFGITEFSGILGFTGFLRVQGEGKYFLPYIEFLAGFRSLWTSSNSGFEDEESGLGSDILHGPWKTNGGFGAGILFPVSISPDSKRIYLDLNLKYMFGGAVEGYTGNYYVFKMGLTFR